MHVRWDAARLPLSRILKSVSDIGYKAEPFDASRREVAMRHERRAALWRLGLAGFCMMQASCSKNRLLRRSTKVAAMQRVIWVLWPSFLMAIAVTGVYFSLFDPVDLTIFGVEIPADRKAAYTIGFFAFWLMAACSSALTCFLRRSPFEVNRCTLEPTERPVGCPKREETYTCCD